MKISLTTDLLTLKPKRPMIKNIIPLFFLVVLGFSCNSDEYQVVPENVPEAPAQEEEIQTPTEPETGTDKGQDIGQTACADCDYVIEPNVYKVDNNVLNLPAGSKIGIKGQNRGSIYIINFHGTAEKPFVFVNCDGQTTITSGSVGIKVHQSSFLRVSGTGSSDKYGIKVTTSLHGIQVEKGATDYEVDHIEVSGASSIGFPARTNPEAAFNRSNFVQRNTWIHDMYIHDVGNEGIYIGGSHWQDVSKNEPELVGVRVYNNRIENTGFDGLQVGSAVEDSKIYNNTVINYGLQNVTYHQAGLMINPGTTGKIYNNTVKGGTGHAIFDTGFDNEVYNNIVINGNKDGMYIADRGTKPGTSYRVFNNTFVNLKGTGVKMTSSASSNNILYNNAVINSNGFLSGSNFDVSNNFVASNVSEAGFTNPANEDFTPTAGSPLIDAGKAVASIGEVLMDYLFNNRVAGTSVDIGACEYQK